MMDDLSGDGVIIIDGAEIETVYYWLTMVPIPPPVVAEGSISGSEDVMRKIKRSKAAKLALVDGPVVVLECLGGKGGVRWVKALRA